MNRILMLDVEALSFQPTAMILQIGVQIVDLSPYNIVFSTAFWPNLDEQKDRTIDADTALWWMQRSPHAIKSVLKGHVGNNTVSMTDIFKTMRQWMAPGDWGFRIGTVWAKPAGFDLSMLTSYFGEKPWGFRQERCMQTVARLLDPEGLIRPKKDETKEHDAQYDVEWQCLYLRNLYEMNPNLSGWDN